MSDLPTNRGVIIMGSAGTGKTALLLRLVESSCFGSGLSEPIYQGTFKMIMEWHATRSIPFQAIFIHPLNTIFSVSELNHVQTYKHMHQSDTSSSTSMASVPSGNTSTSVSPSRSIKYYTSQVSFRQFHSLELESYISFLFILVKQ